MQIDTRLWHFHWTSNKNSTQSVTNQLLWVREKNSHQRGKCHRLTGQFAPLGCTERGSRGLLEAKNQETPFFGPFWDIFAEINIKITTKVRLTLIASLPLHIYVYIHSPLFFSKIVIFLLKPVQVYSVLFSLHISWLLKKALLYLLFVKITYPHHTYHLVKRTPKQTYQFTSS